MTDKTERPAAPSDPVKTSEWRREAEALRKTVSFEMASLRGSAYSGWQKIMGWLLLVISIGGTVDLIAVPRHRHFLIQGSRMVWGQWWSIEDSQMFKLPPPPPRSVESRVIEPSSPVATIPPEEEAWGEPGPAESSASQEPGVPSFAPPPKDQDFQGAFALLTAESNAAGMLVGGENPEYEFKQWNPVQKILPRLLLELVAVDRSTGRELKLIWSVNIQTNEVTALSQLARDLEAQVGR